ncbi:hypothetical protein HHI36_001696 [Cryptolaemus montrouzieri]|uniref:ATP-dependent DNA helicase n=1 Tax=Cryptolaemus montrouzieri TaxID=559131 RepID=A0ABD2P8D5_9CUCU
MFCNDSRPFGGKCILLGGDVKQLLPVPLAECNRPSFFTNCQSWRHFKVLELRTNMRTDPARFQQMASPVGNGYYQRNPKRSSKRYCSFTRRANTRRYQGHIREYRCLNTGR